MTSPHGGRFSANTQNCSYGYDDFTRLTSANCGAAAAQTFSYSADGSGAFGNITKSGSPYSFTPTYSSATNRMTNINGFTPTYDTNGNVLNDNSHTYAWDSQGRPATIDSVNVTYDALGRMVEQNRSGVYTQFVYAPTGQKIQIMNGQAPTKDMVALPGGGLTVYTSGQYYYHSDHPGSYRFASTSTRTMYFDLAYAPFGETYANSGSTEPAFTGQRQDTVAGLYDFPAREYSTQGRWASPDPAGLAAVNPSNPQSWNRYAYVLNNPLVFKDPTGRECVWDDGSFDSSSDPHTGAQALCDQAGGSWIDHSFFSDFGLPDWSGSANGDLAAVASGIQAGFGLVQTGSGLGGWMLVANGGAGPIDWSLLVPPVPTLTYSQQLLGAAAKGANLAAHAIPVPCGGGAFLYGGAAKEGSSAEGSANVLVEYDTSQGLTVNGLFEGGQAGGPGGGVIVGKSGVTPLGFIPTGGAGGVVILNGAVGLYAGDASGNLGYGAGVYVNVTSAAACQ